MDGPRHAQDELLLPTEADYQHMMRFRRTLLEPYTAYYVTRDDLLNFRVFSPAVTSVVNLTLRFQGVNGEILPRFETFTVPPTGASPFVAKLTNAEGTLLSATVDVPAANRGQCFVELVVQRGAGTGDATLGLLLMAGYPSQGNRLGFPESTPATPLDGRGWATTFLVSNPAAGADWVMTVPAGEQWIIRSLQARLTTSATVANRTPALEAEDNFNHVFYSSAIPTLETAGAAWLNTWFTGGAFSNVGNFVQGTLPFELRLQTGWKLLTTTTNIQAGDQWDQIVLFVERFVNA